MIDEIGLEGTENASARDLLGHVVTHAQKSATTPIPYQTQPYGAPETFKTGRDGCSTVMGVPRFLLVGDIRTKNDRVMTMQMQNKLVVAVQGKKAARLRDNDAVERRDKGWKAWAEKSVNEESQAYEEHELPAIQETFADLFDDPNDRQSVAKELRTLLIQSNLIQRNNFVSSDESTSDETSETPTNDDEPAVSTPTSDDEPPLKRQKVGRPARSVTPENDPWLLSSLLELAKSDTQSFAEHELALLACDSRDRRTVEDAFTTRSIPLPCDLVDSVIHMSNPKHASAKAHVNKAREEVFKSQLAKPQPGELLVDFLGQIKRINAGQRLSQSHTHQRQLNNQLTLRDRQ